jgi:hypothetical protein
MGSIAEGKEGDGNQGVRLFNRPVSKALLELLSDSKLAGSQHFAVKEYKDAPGS